MKRTPATILTLLIAVSLLAVPALANGGDTIPHVFYGQVYNVDGSNAPAGSIIVASVAGNASGTTTVTTAGQYGVGPLDGDAEKFAVWNAAIHPGDTITFSIYGVTARESAVYESGGFTNLTLTASAAPPTPTPTGGGGGGPRGGGPVITPIPTPSAPAVPVGQASLPLSATGEVSESVTVRTGDSVGSLTIGEGTRARDADGNPLGEVTIVRADAAGLPPNPPGTAIGLALTCGPAGATFDPPVTITYTLSEEEWERVSDPATLQVMWYNPGTGEWQEVPATVDPATRTVTAQVSHFSLFALTWAAASPAEGATPAMTGAPGAEVTQGEPGAAATGDLPLAAIAMIFGTVVIIAAGFLLLRRR
ncbi:MULTISPECIES: hypothetical protein [unclassified Methanoculleus]|uniref:hypothetical protein n=1 Tax=unclassified Methanoculleus TaxID=2619537 RepID=UPI0025D54815|nr:MULTISPECIES: hypothetical protein [unclassified Methanoculleus]MCK9316901.1 hypothetical protein [Methanoculleus sp.]MDD2253317.1 hypothetical protein [Methanoculleus sp.]MDD2788652.1 hypothetical protein [Methanoculleus sp.]MDD3215105.1 hypothetical protein [Methanoculleus sp.]MDD4313119.1 hypothetical protein [Methanoculleus sp.]